MADVPATRPVTAPIDEPTVATVISLLVHVPPEVPQEIVVNPPSQIVVVPDSDPGTEFTLITFVAIQLPIAYDIVVVPAVTPVTIPAVPTEAVVAALLLHAPPLTVLVSTDVIPRQTVDDPEIDAGAIVTVTFLVL